MLFLPERKLPFRQKSEYPPAKVLYGGQVKFYNVQNKSLGIRLFRAFEHSNLEFVSDFVIRISNLKNQKSAIYNHLVPAPPG